MMPSIRKRESTNQPSVPEVLDVLNLDAYTREELEGWLERHNQSGSIDALFVQRHLMNLRRQDHADH